MLGTKINDDRQYVHDVSKSVFCQSQEDDVRLRVVNSPFMRTATTATRESQIFEWLFSITFKRPITSYEKIFYSNITFSL